MCMAYVLRRHRSHLDLAVSVSLACSAVSAKDLGCLFCFGAAVPIAPHLVCPSWLVGSMQCFVRSRVAVASIQQCFAFLCCCCFGMAGAMTIKEFAAKVDWPGKAEDWVIFLDESLKANDISVRDVSCSLRAYPWDGQSCAGFPADACCYPGSRQGKAELAASNSRKDGFRRGALCTLTLPLDCVRACAPVSGSIRRIPEGVRGCV